ncbi:MAG: 5-demethoxyubiquinol-8 5-hydroxylase UbiM [Leptothrix sp. (in: b-proteobacteria)]
MNHATLAPTDPCSNALTGAPQTDDVLIVGGGPAGLALACALADAGFKATVFERQSAASLADPAPDGRDIALTHRAIGIFRALGLWDHLHPEQIAPIRAADVHNGQSPRFLHFDAQSSGHDALGTLVPNHELRRAAYIGATARPGVRILSGVDVSLVRNRTAGADQAEVQLSDGRRFQAPLLVAADSRFSNARRQLGIGANSRDFGRTVIVCRMQHERPHDGVAHECFRYGGTLALLPMNDNQVSAVLTVRADLAAELLALDPAAFAAHVEQEAEQRLGRMTLLGQRHAYPLVGVYAHHFAAPRVALIGDTAVGMHPVTAHGYNFGLYGVEVLTRQLQQARRRGQDIGTLSVLQAFESEHRRTTLPIYLGTNAIVGLFTDDRAPARLLRSAVLRVAEHLPPLKAVITRQLTGVPRPA